MDSNLKLSVFSCSLRQKNYNYRHPGAFAAVNKGLATCSPKVINIALEKK